MRILFALALLLLGPVDLFRAVVFLEPFLLLDLCKPLKVLLELELLTLTLLR